MDITYTVTTDKSIEDAVNDVKEKLAKVKFGVLWEFDVPATLEKKGVDFEGKAKVLEVCNPHRAKEALESNMNVVYFLPCKIVVYEDENKTKIGMIKPTVFMELMQDEWLEDFARNVEGTIKKALDMAV